MNLESIGMVGETGPMIVPLRYRQMAYPSGQPRFIWPGFAEAELWPAVPLRQRFAANAEGAWKTCADCEGAKLVAEFYRRGEGYHSYCTVCHWARTRELRAAKKAEA